MKILSDASLTIFFVALFSGLSFGQPNENRELKELMNFVVGGKWVSTNPNNEGGPDDYKTFYMTFKNWADENSVLGTIYGIKNNNDTTALIEIWNSIDLQNNTIRYEGRTTWQAHNEGTIKPYEGRHIDIVFKTTMSDGRSYYTRDLHFIESKNRLRAEQYHKKEEEDEWQKAGESIWIRVGD